MGGAVGNHDAKKTDIQKLLQRKKPNASCYDTPNLAVLSGHFRIGGETKQRLKRAFFSEKAVNCLRLMTRGCRLAP